MTEQPKLANLILSAVLAEFPARKGQFKDSYVFEFFGLPEDHKEDDLQQALVLASPDETKTIHPGLLK